MNYIFKLLAVAVVYTSTPVHLQQNRRTPVVHDEIQWFLNAAWGNHLEIHGPSRTRKRSRKRPGCIVPMAASRAAIAAGVYVFTKMSAKFQGSTTIAELNCRAQLQSCW